jgi:hypothetical protein
MDDKLRLPVLASGLADDFNNILTVILGACSMIDMDSNAQPELLRCVSLIRTSAEHAAMLSDQLRQICLVRGKC